MAITTCPACNSRSYTETKVIGIKRCRKCQALYGVCYRGEAYEFYIPRWGEGEAVQYVDLEMLGSGGIERFHGWLNEHKEIVQTG